MKKILFAIGAAFLLIAVPACAQTSSAVVVTACGTPPLTYTAGQMFPLTVDTTGKLCDGSSGGAGSVAGNVGGYDTDVSNTPTVSTSPYTLNYSLGGLQTVSIFRTTAQPSGLLGYVSLASKGGMTTSVTIYGFRKTPASTCTDSAIFTLSSTDLPYLIPGFPVTIAPVASNATTQTTGFAAFVPPTSVINADSTPGKNLYFCAVTNGTPTLGSTSDLVFDYGMIQD